MEKQLAKQGYNKDINRKMSDYRQEQMKNVNESEFKDFKQLSPKTLHEIQQAIIKRLPTDLIHNDIENLVSNNNRFSETLINDSISAMGITDVKKQELLRTEASRNSPSTCDLDSCIQTKIGNTLVDKVEVNIQPNGIDTDNFDNMTFDTISDTLSKLFNESLFANNVESYRKTSLWKEGTAFTGVNLNDSLNTGTSKSFNEEITFSNIDRNNVYADPIAVDIESAKYIILLQRVDFHEKINELRSLKGVDTALLNALHDGVLNKQSEAEELRLFMYYNLYYTNIFLGDDFEEQCEYAVIMRRKWNDKTKQNDIFVQIALGNYVVKEMWLGTTLYPIVASYVDKGAMKFYGNCPTLKAYKIQKDINTLYLIKMFMLKNMSIPGWIIDSSVINGNLSMLSDGISNIGSLYTVSASGGNIQQSIMATPVPYQNIQLFEQAIQIESKKIKDVFNINNAYLGDEGVAGSKASSVNAVIQQAISVDNPIKLNDESYIKSISKIVYDIIRRKKLLKALNYDNSKKPDIDGIILNKIDYAILDNSPMNVMEFQNDIWYKGQEKEMKQSLLLFQQSLQTLQTSPFFDPLMILENSDIPNKRKMFRKINNMVNDNALKSATLFIKMVIQSVQASVQHSQTNNVGQQTPQAPNVQVLMQVLMGLMQGKISPQELAQIAQKMQAQIQQQQQQQAAQQQAQQQQPGNNPAQPKGMPGENAPQPNQQGGM